MAEGIAGTPVWLILQERMQPYTTREPAAAAPAAHPAPTAAALVYPRIYTPLLLVAHVAGMSMLLLSLLSQQHVLAAPAQCTVWSAGQSVPHVITARSSAGRSSFRSPHFHTTVAGGRCNPAASACRCSSRCSSSAVALSPFRAAEGCRGWMPSTCRLAQPHSNAAIFPAGHTVAELDG